MPGGDFDLGNLPGVLQGIASAAQSSAKQVNSLNDSLKNTDKAAKKLEQAQQKIMAASNRANARTQAAATRVSGVYGKAGTNQFSGYKPSGAGGISNSNIDWVKQGDKRFIPEPQKQQSSVFSRLNKTVNDQNGSFQRMNKARFKFQMSTLGLAFSFQGLTSGIEGIMGSLGDLNTMFTNQAMSQAFGGLGGQSPSQLMGVSSDDLVKGWENFKGILADVQNLFAAISAKVLTPDVMAAIANLFTQLSSALANGEVSKALGDIIKDMANFLMALIPVIPPLAQILDILAPIIAPIIVLALVLGELLPVLSLIGYVFQSIGVIFEAITVIAPIVSAIFGAISLPMIAIAAIGVIIVAFFYDLWTELSKGEDIFTALENALIDLWNQISSIVKTATFGLVNLGQASNVGNSTSSSSVVNNNNITINGNMTQSMVPQIAAAANRTG